MGQSLENVPGQLSSFLQHLSCSKETFIIVVQNNTFSLDQFEIFTNKINAEVSILHNKPQQLWSDRVRISGSELYQK